MTRLLFCVLVLVLTTGGKGCIASGKGTDAAMVVKSLPFQYLRPAKKSKQVKNLYYRLASKTNGQQFAEIRLLGQELHAPFRVEARIGDFSKKQVRWTDANERFFITDPNFQRSTHLVRLTFGENGDSTDATVTVSPEIDGESPPDLPLTIQDTRIIDIAMEHTGTEVIYFAKSFDSAQYTEIGRTATTYTGPFVMTFDAFGLPKKAEAGIDDILVTQRTAPPDLDTAKKRAAYATTQAFDDLLVAVKAVDGLADDAATAVAALANASAHLDDAATELIFVDGDTKKAAKSLGIAGKKLRSAVKKLDANKAPSSTVKLLKVALQKIALALFQINEI